MTHKHEPKPLSSSHLPAVFGFGEERQDPVDEIRVVSFLLQIQNPADNLQLGVGEVGISSFKNKVQSVIIANPLIPHHD